ncbi:MAG: gene transfer agent family protein [Rhizobium sp.]|nr:MAG: gene transfer agent family protein [Rhizobium sp.]
MPNGDIDLDFGDNTYRFNIAKIGQVLELEQKCDAGVSEILDRVRSGKWRIQDIRETIRLGLIGGGQTPVNAMQVVKAYVDERPWAESVPVALTVLLAAMIGVPGEKVGKRRARRTKTKAEAASSDPRSTAPEPQSGSRPDRSTKSPSSSSPPLSTASTKPMAPTTTHQTAV